MQQKRRRTTLGLFIALLAVAGGVGMLLMMDVPVPQQQVEKELDAQALFAPKVQ